MGKHYTMKLTIPNVSKPHVLQIALLLCLSTLIWYAGSYLIIANSAPLAQPGKRLYLIIALFLVWLLKILCLDPTPKKIETVPKTISPDLQKKIQTLQGRFQGALDFLKKTTIDKHNMTVRLIDLPWYLVIGSENSGKTTLLANSGINYILSKQFKQENLTHVTASDTCDWWATRDLIMVDVPGQFLTDKVTHTEQKTTASPLWNTLLSLINTSSHHHQLKGVVLTLNLTELLNKENITQKSSSIQTLKKRIAEISASVNQQLPVFLVITKCDLLPGFSEFFSDCGSDELTQAWGVTLPTPQPNEKLLDIFSSRFNALIKRLNKQLIWRMHQERNPLARAHIKDFPLQVERLKESILHFIKICPGLKLHGVYLTSALQNSPNQPENNTLSHLALQIMRTPVMPSRTYFVTQMISHGFLNIPNTTFHHAKNALAWKKRLIYTASITIITAAALVLGHDFKKSVEKAYSVQNELTRYQLNLKQPAQNSERIAQALPLLNALYQAANKPQHPLSNLEHIGSFYTNKSQQTAAEVYHQALQTIFLPLLKNTFESYLQSANNNNTNETYNVLKAYSMIGDSAHRDIPYIIATFKQINSAALNPETSNALTNHIQMLLHANLTTPINTQLVTNVRKLFLTLPPTELAMVLLKSMNNNDNDSSIGLGTFGNPPIFVSRGVINRIPNMFTRANFENILLDEINLAAQESLKGNWVLGNFESSQNTASFDELASQLRTQYIANYVDVWESLLANIQPYTPTNLTQTDEMITNLTSSHSPLLQLLQTIKYNTSFEPILAASPKIQALNHLITDIGNNQQSTLYQHFIGLQTLHAFLQPLLNSENGSNVAFQLTQQYTKNTLPLPITHLHELAEQSPEPLKTWLNTIADESWKFILDEASQHTNNALRASSTAQGAYNVDDLNHFAFNNDNTAPEVS